MTTEKAIAAALEPIIDDVVALERYVAALQLKPGPKGEAADPRAVADLLAADPAFLACVKGQKGFDGRNGAGIDTPHHVAGAVYREGTFVVAHMGQHFVAVKDTAGAPGECADWRRVGSWGFRHRGTFDKDAAYVDGDLFIKDFGTFCVVNGAPVLFAGRGAPGRPGEPGARGVGAPGKDGRNGSTLIGAQVQGFKLVLVAQNADGAVDHLEADFAPAYRELLRELVAEAMPELVAQVAELRDEVAHLKRNGRRVHV